MYNIEVRHRFRVYDRLFDSYSPYFSKRVEALNFAATLIRLDPRYRHRVNPADLIFDGSGVSKYRFKRYEITSKGLSLEEHCYEKRCHIECDGVIMSVESLLKGYSVQGETAEPSLRGGSPEVIAEKRSLRAAHTV